MERCSPSRIILVIAAVAQLAAPIHRSAASESGDRENADRERFHFALWGDMPYRTPGLPDLQTPKIKPLIDDINASDVSFTIFDGDMQGGLTPCVDDLYTTAIARFNSFKNPMIFVPGDNEWVDCQRIPGGGFNNLERLDHLRKTMFATRTSFGQRKFQLTHQGPPGGLYSENTRWSFGDIVFVGLNVPGSNNNKVTGPFDCFAFSVRTQADCDADNAEFAARDAADIAFLHETFALASSHHTPGLVVVIQADPSFDLPETPANERTETPFVDGYNAFVAALIAETKAFAGQVLLVHGDTHYFKVDKPLLDQAHLLTNFTRVETFGSPNIHWVRVSVDTRSRNVFTVRPMIVPGN